MAGIAIAVPIIVCGLENCHSVFSKLCLRLAPTSPLLLPPSLLGPVPFIEPATDIS